MAKYLANSDDITIEEVAGTDSIQFQTKYSMDDLKNSIDNICVNTESTSTTNAYSADYINDCNTYSENETFTGKYWIDGKPIYRKVLISTYSASGSGSFTKTITTDTTINTMISYDGLYYETGGSLSKYINKLGTMTISGVNYQSTINYDKDSNAIKIGMGGKSSSQTVKFVVIIEYTKSS